MKYYPADGGASRKAHGHSTRKGTVLQDHALGQMVDVVLDGDPFGTYVPFNRLQLIPGERDDDNWIIIKSKEHRARNPKKESEEVPTATTTNKPSARDLRKQAKALGISGWEDMGVSELQKAIKEAGGGETPRRTTAAKSTTGTVKRSAASKANAETTKRVAAKKAAKAADEDRELPENGNPFKEGSNLWHIAEELIKGGKRSSMVARLKRKIELKPRTEKDDWDEDYEYDRRVLIVGQILRNQHGFEVTRDGRGADATIKAVAP